MIWLAPRRLAHALALLVVLCAAAAPASAHADPGQDERELQAREDFAAGRYQLALEIFARLYAETLHPTYLRNIGRCYQNLGEPDRAITSFREYLHKRTNISAEERAEIEGYIKEMEELKRARAATGGAAKPAAAPPPRSLAAPVLAPPAAAAPAPRPAVDLARTAPPSAPPREEPELYERWWFWAAVAGAVAAGVGVAAAAGAFTHTDNAACPTGFICGH
jgi:tetratricopeptide (TPR) repeat protein